MSAHPPSAAAPPINISDYERIVCAIGGAALASYGLARRSGALPAFLLAGGYLIRRGLKGHCQVYERLGIDLSGPAEGK